MFESAVQPFVKTGGQDMANRGALNYEVCLYGDQRPIAAALLRVELLAAWIFYSNRLTLCPIEQPMR